MDFHQWASSLFLPGKIDAWISGLTGAGGAILGSLVTIFWTEFYNARARHRDRIDKDQVASFAVFHRLNTIYSGGISTRKHLTEGIDDAKKMSLLALCLRVQPISPLPAPIHFQVDELWSMHRVGGAVLTNLLGALDLQYNTVAQSLEMYRERHDALLAKLQPERMEGLVGSMNVTAAELLKIQPDLAVCDDMLSQIAPDLDNLVDRSFDALTILIEAKSKPLGKYFAIEVPDPKGNKVHLGKLSRKAKKRLREAQRSRPS